MVVASVLIDLVAPAAWAVNTPTWAWAVCITMLVAVLGALRQRHGADLNHSALFSVHGCTGWLAFPQKHNVGILSSGPCVQHLCVPPECSVRTAWWVGLSPATSWHKHLRCERVQQEAGGLEGAQTRGRLCRSVTQQATTTQVRPGSHLLGRTGMCPMAPATLPLLQAPQKVS